MVLKRVNTALLIGILLIVAYIVIAPVTPLAVFWIEEHSGARLQKLTREVKLPAAKINDAPGDDRLVIPAMLLSVPINEGKDLSALRTGPWRRPNGSTPDKGGNTVIAGHRFTYANPRGIFYFLNKLKPGDEAAVFWHGKRYVYKVSDVKTVPPTDEAIEAPTSDARLTLYTCTPLWLPKDRLVVTAELEQP